MKSEEIIEKIKETKKFFEEIESYECSYTIAELEREIMAMCDELVERLGEEN